MRILHTSGSFVDGSLFASFNGKSRASLPEYSLNFGGDLIDKNNSKIKNINKNLLTY
jgi:hypothetical protein